MAIKVKVGSGTPQVIPSTTDILSFLKTPPLLQGLA